MAGKKTRPRAIATYLKALRRFMALAGRRADGERRRRLDRALPDRAERQGAGDDRQRPERDPQLLPLVHSRQAAADDPTLELEWPKRTEPIPRALKARELRLLEQVLAAPLPVLNTKTRHVQFRHKRAILLMLYCGLRSARCRRSTGRMWISTRRP
jgi:hypothetical protein